MMAETSRTRLVIKNALGSYLVKGAALIISFLTMPAYIRYFQDQAVLGMWYTILSVITWIYMFDFGIGNGLRNQLAASLAVGNADASKRIVSSSVFCIGVISLALLLIFLIANPFVGWNEVFGISRETVSPSTLSMCMLIVGVGIIIQFFLRIVSSILYAMQKSALVNLLAFLPNAMLLLYLLVAPTGSVDDNLINLAFAHIVAINLPLLVAFVVVVGFALEDCRPRLSAVDIRTSRDVIGTGFTMMWLQLVWMVVSATHPMLISAITTSSDVVEYQIYYKVFYTGASLLILAIVPVWSAVTDASARGEFGWVIRAYKRYSLFVVVALAIEMAIVPFLQVIFDIWLGDSSIKVDLGYALVFVLFGAVFVWHNVNTSFANGLSMFRTQKIWMSVAAAAMIPLSMILCECLGSWIGVVLGCTVAIIPYQIAQTLSFACIAKKRR